MRDHVDLKGGPTKKSSAFPFSAISRFKIINYVYQKYLKTVHGDAQVDSNPISRQIKQVPIKKIPLLVNGNLFMYYYRMDCEDLPQFEE